MHLYILHVTHTRTNCRITLCMLIFAIIESTFRIDTHYIVR